MWKNGGCGVLPQVNLVSNIGFRNDATHTTEESSPAANMAVQPLGPMSFPGRIAIDTDADALTFSTHFCPPAQAKAASPSKEKNSSAKQRDRLARLSGELAAIRESLAWRIVGRRLFSIEKRWRRLFGRKDQGDDGA